MNFPSCLGFCAVPCGPDSSFLPLLASWKRKLEQKQRRQAALRKEGAEIRRKEAPSAGGRNKRILKVSDAKKRQNLENGHVNEGKGKTAA